jgi:hypothetical protein
LDSDVSGLVEYTDAAVADKAASARIAVARYDPMPPLRDVVGGSG